MRVAGFIVILLGGLLLLSSLKLTLTEYDLSSTRDQGSALGGFAFAILVLAGGVSLLSRARRPREGEAAAISNAEDTDRQVRMVIRIFQYMGWPLSIVFGVNTAISLVLSLPLLSRGNAEDFPLVLVAIVVNAVLTTFFATLIWVAKRMRARSISARSPAMALSALMLLGFPLFTIVGVICLTTISSKYAAYCDSSPIGSA